MPSVTLGMLKNKYNEVLLLKTSNLKTPQKLKKMTVFLFALWLGMNLFLILIWLFNIFLTAFSKFIQFWINISARTPQFYILNIFFDTLTPYLFAIFLFEIFSLINLIFSLFKTWILQVKAGRKIQFKLGEKMNKGFIGCP